MSSRCKRKRFACGHLGKGQHCHRCEQAVMLEKMANKGKRLINHKKSHHEKPHVWTIEDMFEEAKRLKGPM